jgi:iron complex outermembrane recepter protein
VRDRTHLQRAIRKALLASGVAASLLAANAFAQDQDQDQDVDDVQTVVVTGSRIARPELEATVPTVVLDAEKLAQQGFENFADVAQSMPQFAPAFGTSRTQSTFSGAAASGLNTANLRNLASVRTVVLINGRRVPGGTTTSTTVDFNTIPTANIERIELLTGGAAAIYGADAVAGVINIITKKNFEGIEIGASYGAADEGDNQNPSGHLMMGGAFGDRGHGLVTLQYDKQGRVRCADRFLCAEDFAWLSATGAPLRGPAAYSGVGLAPRIFLPNGSSVTSRNGSFTDAGGNLIPFDVTIDGYNRNADRDLAIPTERIMLAAEAEYGLTDSVSAFLELNYGQAEIDSQFEGHPFQSQAAGSLVGGGPGVAGAQASIPLNNPFVPAQIFNAYLAQNPMANPATDQITWWQRFNHFAARGAENNRETVRGVAGFRGDIESLGFGKDWSWELHHVYGRTTLDSLTEGLVGTDRLLNSLRVEQVPGGPAGTYRCIDATARALGCVPVNPFQPYTQQMLDYLNVSAGQAGISELQDSQAFVTGTLMDLPAGPLQTAVGVERRTFNGFLNYDETINRGLATGNQIGDVSFVEIESKEAYIETLVPVLQDLPFAESVSLEAAYRRSDTDVGEYGTWKYGGDWSPVQGLRLRAMRARSVRTPVPGELSGIGQTFGTIADPCTAARRNANATRAANCTADGVPANYAPALTIEQGVGGFSGGNPLLNPEEATSLTFGFVFTPTFIENFSMTVDRFSIDVEGIITTVARQTETNLCYDTAERLFCDQLTRGTSPLLPGATYVLTAVNEQAQNVAETNVSGFDVEIDYNFNLGSLFGADSDIGKITLEALLTFYDKADLKPLPTSDAIDLLGAAGGSTSDQGFIKRQGVLNLGYSRGPIHANWHTRYLSKSDMSPFTTGFPEIGSHVYHDMRVGFNFGESSEVYLGLNNVFDKEPPFFATNTAGTQALDTIPGYYDIFGRSYYGGMRVKF